MAETPRAQPQQPPNDRETTDKEEEETPPAQLQQPPNYRETTDIEEDETPPAPPQQQSYDPVAAENNRRRIDPKLLRAIVNGDLISVKSILGTNVPTDIESTRETDNGGNGVVGGVTFGENNALHVVAGVSITSPTSLRRQITRIYSLVLIFLWGIRLIQFFQMCWNITINRVIIFVSVHFPWTPQKNYEKAKRTWWLKWDFSFYKRRMYMDIADIIYNQDPTLLYKLNCAGETPLHCAANAGNLHMVSLLVKFACTEGQQKLERLLQARNQVGETALHGAARSCYSGIVKELLRADETVACLEDHNGIACLEDDNGISPLYLAVTAGCLDVVQQLIAPNCLTSYTGPDGQTALHAAVLRQKGPIMTVLHAAALRQKENIAQVVLQWHPSLAAITDKEGNTPLHYAAINGNTYAVRKLLLKDTESVYKVNSYGLFPVHLAAEEGNVEVIKELQSICPDVGELLNNEKKNFLHVAVENKKIRVIRWACQKGINADVMNAKDNDGNTPLHLAVISSELEISFLLCTYKIVNLNIRNKAGLTPMDISAYSLDHGLKYSLVHADVIYYKLLYRGAFRNPLQPDLSKKVVNLVEARADCPSRTEDDIEKELTDCENKFKSLTTGAVLIASATFVGIFTVSKVYDDTRGDNTSSPTLLSIKKVFIAFVIADMVAFICALVSTIWLLYAALSNSLPMYRKIYFQMCTPLLYGALHLFILAFGLGSYIAIAPHNPLLAFVILQISGLSFVFTILSNPNIIFPTTIIHRLAKVY